MGHVQQMFVFDRVGQPVAGQAGLTRAQGVAATTQAKILIGDDEAVIGVAQQRQAAAGRFVDPILVQ